MLTLLETYSNITFYIKHERFSSYSKDESRQNIKCLFFIHYGTCNMKNDERPVDVGLLLPIYDELSLSQAKGC